MLKRIWQLLTFFLLFRMWVLFSICGPTVVLLSCSRNPWNRSVWRIFRPDTLEYTGGLMSWLHTTSPSSVCVHRSTFSPLPRQLSITVLTMPRNSNKLESLSVKILTAFSNCTDSEEFTVWQMSIISTRAACWFKSWSRTMEYIWNEIKHRYITKNINYLKLNISDFSRGVIGKSDPWTCTLPQIFIYMYIKELILTKMYITTQEEK